MQAPAPEVQALVLVVRVAQLAATEPHSVPDSHVDVRFPQV